MRKKELSLEQLFAIESFQRTVAALDEQQAKELLVQLKVLLLQKKNAFVRLTGVEIED